MWKSDRSTPNRWNLDTRYIVFCYCMYINLNEMEYVDTANVSAMVQYNSLLQDNNSCISEYSRNSTRQRLYKIVSSQQQCTTWKISHSRMHIDTQHSERIHGDKNFIAWEKEGWDQYNGKLVINIILHIQLCTYKIDKSDTLFFFLQFFHPNAIIMSWDILHCWWSVVKSWCNCNIKFWHFKAIMS